MKNQSVIIVTNRKRNEFLESSIHSKTKRKTFLITKEEQFTYDQIIDLNPEWIFVPHWSKIIPAEIYENFRVVIFHMTDLPFGRGGSPLQNLIIRGFENTVISAIQCTEELDAGDIYLKEPLNLNGTADEILLRASFVIEKMIIRILEENPTPIPQKGKVTFFQRRKPDQSKLDFENIQTLDQFYDYIRMLDGEGYPNAFLEIGNFRIIFSSPHRRSGHLESQVKIEYIDQSSLGN
ncbi:formyltransferase family protein [Thermosynechococcaceae cyanobacterium Okahandja]